MNADQTKPLESIPQAKLILMQALSTEVLASRVNTILERLGREQLSVSAVKRYRDGLLKPSKGYQNGPPDYFVDAIKLI